MTKEMERLLWLHQQLSLQIDREFESLAQRMLWLLTGNAFLFTVTAICINVSPLSRYSSLSPFLIGGSTGLGMLICTASFQGMKAARQVIADRKMSRSVIEAEIKGIYEFEDEITVPLDANHYWGNGPLIHLPFAIFCIWSLIAYNLWKVLA